MFMTLSIASLHLVFYLLTIVKHSKYLILLLYKDHKLLSQNKKKKKKSLSMDISVINVNKWFKPVNLANP